MKAVRHLMLLGLLVFVLISGQGTSSAQTPMPVPAATPKPTVTPPTTTQTPLRPRWQLIDLGVPAGNAHGPISLSLDEVNGLAYVFSARVPESDGRNHSAISVVDIDRGTVVRRQPVALDGNTTGWAKLTVTRNGQTGYLLNKNTNDLYTYDPQNDEIALALTGVIDFFLSRDEQNIVIQRSGSMAVYSPQLRTLRWQLHNNPQQMAVADGAILAEDRNELGSHLTLYSMANGVPISQIDMPGQIDALALGPDASWFVAFRQTNPIVWRLDRNLAVLVETVGLSGASLFYDDARNRLIVSGVKYQPGEDAVYLLRALNGDDLQTETEQRWHDWTVPNEMSISAHAIVGIYTNDEQDRLYRLDIASLAPIETTALGIRLEEIVVDSAHGRLYVADNQDHIHSIDLASGEILDVWEGMRPLALDATNGRLYVNRYQGHRRQIVALDSDGGDALVHFPQGGTPAFDPQRDLVYIADGGVSIYDRSGRLLGRLDSTFPDPAGFIPNPHAVSIAVNPTSGALIVFMNNGVPGSNNRTGVSVYPAPTDDERMPIDQPVYVPNPDNAITTVAFDQETGDTFLTYSGFRSITAIQRVGPQGEVLDQVGGRTGRLHYHAPGRSLYVQQNDLLAQFNETLELVDLLLAPIDLDLSVLDEHSGDFYYAATWQGPVVVHHRLDDLAHLTWENPGNTYLNALPDGKVSRLLVVEHGERSPLLFATLQDGSLFQSNEGGARWRQRYLGTLTTSEYLTEAADGIFYSTGGSYYGGDGVFRSDDGGESWWLMNEGLTNLHGIEAIHTVDPDRLYLVTTQQQIHVWDRSVGEWTLISVPADTYLAMNQFQLAPDGTLYIRGYSQVHRSDDGGESWQILAAPPQGMELWQFAPDFVQSQRIYGLVNSYATGGRTLYRSDDGGVSWQPADPGYFWPATSTYIQLDLFMGDGALFAVEHDDAQITMVYRSPDQGDHWEQLADPQQMVGAQAAQLAAGNRLWFIQNQTAVSLDLDALAWEIVPASAPTPASTTPLPSTPVAMAISPPAPSPTLLPTATPHACSLGIDDADRLVQELVPALGCPLADPLETFLARQPFERGIMVWRQDVMHIYVLGDDGHWQGFDDTWDESQGVEDAGLMAPSERHQPVRGFGKVWREELGGPNAGIGWATTVESGSVAAVQAWSGGTLLIFVPGERYALLDDGRWQRVE